MVRFVLPSGRHIFMCQSMDEDAGLLRVPTATHGEVEMDLTKGGKREAMAVLSGIPILSPRARILSLWAQDVLNLKCDLARKEETFCRHLEVLLGRGRRNIAKIQEDLAMEAESILRTTEAINSAAEGAIEELEEIVSLTRETGKQPCKK